MLPLQGRAARARGGLRLSRACRRRSPRCASAHARTARARCSTRFRAEVWRFGNYQFFRIAIFSIKTIPPTCQSQEERERRHALHRTTGSRDTCRLELSTALRILCTPHTPLAFAHQPTNRTRRPRSQLTTPKLTRRFTHRSGWHSDNHIWCMYRTHTPPRKSLPGSPLPSLVRCLTNKRPQKS